MKPGNVVLVHDDETNKFVARIYRPIRASEKKGTPGFFLVARDTGCPEIYRPGKTKVLGVAVRRVTNMDTGDDDV